MKLMCCTDVLTDNARYAKLRWQVRELELVIQKAVYIASGHLRAFARLKVIRDEIIGCKEVIQILRKTFVLICSNAQDVCIASAAVCGQPCFTKVWANIRQEDVAFLVYGDITSRRQK